MSTLERIYNYLQMGGLFNPEMMEHEKVRDLLMACRDDLKELAIITADRNGVKEINERHRADLATLRAQLATAESQRERLLAALRVATNHLARISSPDTRWENPLMMALRAAIASAEQARKGRTDAERLDWLDKATPHIFWSAVCNHPMNPEGECAVATGPNEVVYAKTYRQAIDAALDRDAASREDRHDA